MLYCDTFIICLTSRFRALSFDVLAACHADRRWAIDFGDGPLTVYSNRCRIVDPERQSGRSGRSGP